MEYKLRPYQEKTKTDAEAFLNNSSFKKGLIIKPVASGKALDTAIISELTNKKCLVIQPDSNLLKQNLEKARHFGMDPSVYSSSLKSKNISDLTYATPLSLANSAKDFEDFDIVIIDEAHDGMTNALQKGKVASKGKFNLFLEHINPSKIIGLTATPLQLVNTSLGSELRMINRSKRSFWYQSDIFHVTQIQDIKDKYWAHLDFRVLENKGDFKLQLNSTGNDFTEDSIIKAYEANMSNDKILENYEQLLSEGKKSMLTFIPSIKIGEELKKLNNDFEIVHSKMPDKKREDLIINFKKGNIPNLINCDSLTTGFDHPHLDAIIVARNTNSFTLYYQIIGRLVRPIMMPDGSVFKKQGTVVDLTSNYSRFGTVENITFEKQDYTKGWAMWNGDHIMTGYPFGNWKTPTRDSLQKHYKSNQDIKKQSKEECILPFGKYAGKNIKDIFKKDRGYLKWLLGNKDFTWKSQTLKQTIQTEMENLLKEELINN